jgi:hypothetical protein
MSGGKHTKGVEPTDSITAKLVNIVTMGGKFPASVALTLAQRRAKNDSYATPD